MAQEPTVTHIDHSLRYDHAMIDELLEITSEWNEIPEGELAGWTMDWTQFALEKTRKDQNDH